ncbi:hypothetical protein GGF50DRAFT_106202 [Schizophyllum commune]
MSDREVQQLVEMGATTAQARAALRRYKDVMEAAEKFFEGEFADVKDEDGDSPMAATSSSKASKRLATPEPEDGEDEDEDEDGDGEAEDDDEYFDYDSDFGDGPTNNGGAQADPYAGIFFSKDRREEVIEVEEEPEEVTLSDGRKAKLMTQGQWMKGCSEGSEQSFLFQLYTQLSEGACPCPNAGCTYSIQRHKRDFFTIYPSFSQYIDHLRGILQRRCPNCQTDFCFACGEHLSADKVKRPSMAQDDNPLFHCSNLQGVLLGVGLSMLEQMFVEQREQGPSRNAERTAKRRKTQTPTLPSGDDDDDTYYAGVSVKQKGGIGYAGDQKEDHSGQQEAMALQQAKDRTIAALLTQIREYLPSLRRPGGSRTSDYLVHPTALAHLRRRFNYVCSTLLRNDSLADMSERSTLYFELLEWLETISNHEALASMMGMPIMVPQSVKTTTTRKSSNGPPVRERTIVYEGSAGPRELLESIAIQARAALKGLEGMKAQEPSEVELTEEQKRMTNDNKGKSREEPRAMNEENERLLSFCTRIVATAQAIDRSLRETKGDAFVKRLHDSLPKVNTTSAGAEAYAVQAGDTEEDAMKAYVDWATQVRFEYCDLTVPDLETEDGTPHYKFYYNNEARMLATSDIPKRSLAIAKELATLTTNLPVAWHSSIFLRVDETRVDVIKALITGPEGTPYYNGCYCFDIFLGATYNQSPPSVKYMTTGGGQYRFNPNLYADGKVCLSLLGTWSGPGWVAGKSTLLQVLISIQSMILCDEPYLNEPGWANQQGSAASMAYTKNCRRMNVRIAMLENLKNPPEPFGDIIQTHFRLKARSITAQLDKWLEEDDGFQLAQDGGSVAGSAGGLRGALPGARNSTAFKRDVDELKTLLANL